MTWLAIALALSAHDVGPPPPTRPWRLIDAPDVHVGVRPAAFVDDEGSGGRREAGMGLTVQISSTRLL